MQLSTYPFLMTLTYKIHQTRAVNINWNKTEAPLSEKEKWVSKNKHQLFHSVKEKAAWRSYSRGVADRSPPERRKQLIRGLTFDPVCTMWECLIGYALPLADSTVAILLFICVSLFHELGILCNLCRKMRILCFDWHYQAGHNLSYVHHKRLGLQARCWQRIFLVR